MFALMLIIWGHACFQVNIGFTVHLYSKQYATGLNCCMWNLSKNDAFFCVFRALVLSPCQTLGLLLMVSSWLRWVIYYLGIIRISKNITIWQGTFSPSGVNEGGRSHCRDLTIDCRLYTSLIIVVYQTDLYVESCCWSDMVTFWHSDMIFNF